MKRAASASLLLVLALSRPVWAVDQYSYRVVERRPQSPDLYVQGLQIVDGLLYVSTGLQGRSRLLRYRFDDGTLETVRDLDRRLFGEGLTVMGDAVYQLTWKHRRLLVYNRTDLSPRTRLSLPGQGWGLTDDGHRLIYSDGSHRLHFMDPQSGRITHSLAVTENGRPLGRLNELEWIDGEVWANIWYEDRIVAIDPASGEVTASVDLSGLWPRGMHRDPADVLNGIARNPADGALWVTGKRWPWMFRIELVPVADAS